MWRLSCARGSCELGFPIQEGISHQPASSGSLCSTYFGNGGNIVAACQEPSTTRTSSNALKSPPLLKIFKDFEASGTDLSMWHRWWYSYVLSNDQSYGYTYCKGQLQGSNAGKRQNFGDEGGKRVVTASGYVPSDRRGVTDRDWEGYWKCEGKSKT